MVERLGGVLGSEKVAEKGRGMREEKGFVEGGVGEER